MVTNSKFVVLLRRSIRIFKLVPLTLVSIELKRGQLQVLTEAVLSAVPSMIIPELPNADILLIPVGILIVSSTALRTKQNISTAVKGCLAQSEIEARTCGLVDL